MNKLSLTVAIPVYNEEECLHELVQRLQKTLQDYKNAQFLFVLDGCTDKSCEILKKFQEKDKRIIIAELTRNFGLQAAVHACLKLSKGDVFVLLDSDLQDPPELIPKLLTKLAEGYDIVYAERKSRQDSLLNKIFFKMFYSIQNKLSEIIIPEQAGNYSCLNRKSIDEILKLTETNRFFPGLRAWVGMNSVEVQYDRDNRFAGKRKQTFSKLFSYAMDGIYNFSYLPLKFSFLIGVFCLLFGLAMILNVLYQKLYLDSAIPGWTSTIITIALFSGAQLMSIGILGNYIKRIYDEVRNRPQYIIQKIWESKD